MGTASRCFADAFWNSATRRKPLPSDGPLRAVLRKRVEHGCSWFFLRTKGAQIHLIKICEIGICFFGGKPVFEANGMSISQRFFGGTTLRNDCPSQRMWMRDSFGESHRSDSSIELANESCAYLYLYDRTCLVPTNANLAYICIHHIFFSALPFTCVSVLTAPFQDLPKWSLTTPGDLVAFGFAHEKSHQLTESADTV